MAVTHIGVISDGIVFEHEVSFVPFFEEAALLEYYASHFERNWVASDVVLHVLL